MSHNSSPSLEILGNDILHQICQIVSEFPYEVESPYGEKSGHPLTGLSAVSKAFRELTAPYHFKKVFVKEKEWNGENWRGSLKKLTTLLEQDSWILKYVRAYDFATFMKQRDQEQLPPEVAKIFAKTLKMLPRLQTLTLVLPPEHMDKFIDALKVEQVTLPNVGTLNIGCKYEAIINLCPNVNTIRAHRWSYGSRSNITSDEHRFLEVALMAPKLVELDVSCSWSVDMASLLVRSPNNIASLSKISQNYGCSIEGIVLELSKLKNLRSLSFMCVSYLDMGYHPPRCGNGWRFPGAVAHYRKQKLDAESKMTDAISRAFAGQSELRKFELGDVVYLRAANERLKWVRQRHWSDRDEKEEEEVEKEESIS